MTAIRKQHWRQRGTRTLCATTVGLLVSACSALVPSTPPTARLDVPGRWSSAAVQKSASGAGAATPLALWWRRFNDPLLVELVDAALVHNSSIASARAALAQARALKDVQAGARWPLLAASASAQRARGQAGNGGASGSSNHFAAGFDASWELDVFGGQRAAVRAADADVVASSASLADVQVSVAAEVAIDYLNLRCLQTRLTLAGAGLLSQQETLQLTAWRVQAGQITALELNQARTAVEQTRAQIPALQSALAQSASSLALLTGQAPGVLRPRLAEAGDGRSDGRSDSRNASRSDSCGARDLQPLIAAVPAVTLRQRPDVHAAEARVAAAAALVTQADAARLPDFSLGGSLGLNALTVATLPNGAAVVASLLASVSAPLFDGGVQRANVRVHQALLDQAGASYAATVLAALKDVEDALVALRSESERQLSLAAAASASANAAVLASARYRSGLIDFQVVLETQRVSLAAQDALALSTSERNADQVRLYKALGGGWPAPPADASAPLNPPPGQGGAP